MVARGHYFRKRVGRIHMAKDGYKFVHDRRNVTFLNTPLSRFPYINQLLNVCTHNTGSVEVSGSIPLGSTNYMSNDVQYRSITPAIDGFFVYTMSKDIQ